MTGARRSLVAVAAIVAVCWLGGFLLFLNVTRHHPDASLPPHTDGIVALTGGAGRVELALRLLANGQADRLLLSGIGGGTDLGTLGRRAGIDTTLLSNRVTLGRYAASTRGNGVEAASWAEQNGIASLIVVTAAYHMPRALAELRQSLPGVRLFPFPVTPAGDRGTPEKGPSLRQEAEEYSKYLLAVSGLTAWLPHREPALAHANTGG